MKNRGQMILLMLIMVVSILLCAGLRQKRLDRQMILEDVARQSGESNAAWNATDDAKLVIQEQNRQLTEEIREAELQLRESTQKAVDIEAQLGPLREEKADLEDRLSRAGDRKEAADAATAKAEQKTAALSEAKDALTAALASDDPEVKAEAVRKLEQLLEEE